MSMRQSPLVSPEAAELYLSKRCARGYQDLSSAPSRYGSQGYLPTRRPSADRVDRVAPRFSGASLYFRGSSRLPAPPRPASALTWSRSSSRLLGLPRPASDSRGRGRLRGYPPRRGSPRQPRGAAVLDIAGPPW